MLNLPFNEVNTSDTTNLIDILATKIIILTLNKNIRSARAALRVI
jgi:hypothetical protein